MNPDGSRYLGKLGELRKAELLLGSEWVEVPLLAPEDPVPDGKLLIQLEPADEGRTWRRASVDFDRPTGTHPVQSDP